MEALRPTRVPRAETVTQVALDTRRQTLSTRPQPVVATKHPAAALEAMRQVGPLAAVEARRQVEARQQVVHLAALEKRQADQKDDYAEDSQPSPADTIVNEPVITPTAATTTNTHTHASATYINLCTPTVS